ncbi:kinase-like domain-containing protein [Chaetomium strumarium]|uniref:Kinase-like domain-containing protein n=1 Tax=Chaetomium strumarium TaxID=1170767 RepID=A0AAJ0GYZ2_9PEZI|nr:kinase-like domain-containing protein [Chaetomium strumarium]
MGSADVFDQEVKALKKQSMTPHDHLISLLASYSYRERHYLIFPWAEADLYRYWKDMNPVPSLELGSSYTPWVMRQCLGLARGLAELHEARVGDDNHANSGDEHLLYGRHGDIKPENILVRSGGPVVNIGYTNTYAPPEVLLQRSIIQAFDIWSLGCAYLEFVTWLLYGWQGVEKFSQRRAREDDLTPGHFATDAFYQTTIADETELTTLKQAILETIQLLRAHTKVSEAIQEILNMIQDDMLRIEHTERINTPALVQKLQEIVTLCQRSNDYATTPVPRAAKTEAPTQYALSKAFKEGQPDLAPEPQATPHSGRQFSRIRVYSARRKSALRRSVSTRMSIVEQLAHIGGYHA